MTINKISSTNPIQQNQGDAYYWQHQDKLQPSALTFNAFLKKEHRPSEEKQAALKVEEQRADENPSTEYVPKLFGKTIQIPEASDPISLYLRSLNTEQTAKQTTLNPSAFLLEERPELKPESLKPKQAEAETTQTPCERPLFKKQQLFIEGKEAELALQLQVKTEHEEKKHLNEIKTRFKACGLQLKKILINGVLK